MGIENMPSPSCSFAPSAPFCGYSNFAIAYVALGKQFSLLELLSSVLVY